MQRLLIPCFPTLIHSDIKGYNRLFTLYMSLVFTARCYAERGYEIACRLSVCLSVCPSVRDV